MKRSDISDRVALEAVLRGSYDNAIGPPEPGLPGRNVWERLHDLIGPYPWKVGLRKIEQLDDRRWIECGTSLNYAWRRPEGNEELRRLLLEDAMRYGVCFRCGWPRSYWITVDEHEVTAGIGCRRCVRFVARLQETGDQIAARLTEEFDHALPEGTSVVFELEDL